MEVPNAPDAREGQGVRRRRRCRHATRPRPHNIIGRHTRPSTHAQWCGVERPVAAGTTADVHGPKALVNVVPRRVRTRTAAQRTRDTRGMKRTRGRSTGKQLPKPGDWHLRSAPRMPAEAGDRRYRSRAIHAGSWSLPSPPRRVRRLMPASAFRSAAESLSQMWSKSW